MSMLDKMVVRPGNAIYMQAAQREAWAWSPENVIDSKGSPEYFHPRIVAYRNSKICGDSMISWPELIKQRYGRFGTACSLGSGTGWIEKALLELDLFDRLELFDLSEPALTLSVQNLMGVGSRRCEVIGTQQDINFIELPRNRYDFILCHSALHHIINLEHVFDQITHALTGNGILVIDEFIGPSRWQWSPKIICLVNTLNQLIAAGGQVHDRLRTLSVAGLKLYAPFEAIRSGELGELIRQTFNETRIIESRFMGLLYPALHTLDLSDFSNPDFNRIIETYIELDRCLTELNLVEPCFHFGVYRKPSSKNFAVKQWTEEDVIRYLHVGQGTKIALKTRRWLSQKLSESPEGQKVRESVRMILRRG